MTARTPTPEQALITGAFTAGKGLVIEAGAGTGKTTTLKMLAAAKPRARGIYLAYNRAIASDAKRSFPSSVKCSTAHGLAFGAVGRQFAHRLNTSRVPARETARILRITGPAKIGERMLSPEQVARLTMETVGRYCKSADRELGRWHVPRKPGLGQDDPGVHRELADLLLPFAGRAWDDLTSSDGRLRFEHDCQPPGTLVTVVASGYHNGRWNGEPRAIELTQIPIEDVREGDKVVSWGGSRLGYIRRAGRKVTAVGSRHYRGDLVTIETPTGHRSSYTAEHTCIAHIADALDGKRVVYLMRRGNDYRIGRTPWRLGSQHNTFGPVHRATTQGADAIWILSAHETDEDAALAEALAQQEFNIPGWQFRSANELMPLDTFWSKVGNNYEQARRCLTAHGRDIRYPLWQNDGRHYQRRPIEVRACNLMDGMRVCVMDKVQPDAQGGLRCGSWTDAWQPIAVSRAPYEGPVYNLNVDVDHTYVADGIVTHNCYLKLWQMSGPRLNADYVLFDEAQDANPVVLSVVTQQSGSQLVAVGDRSQAIYGWNGAVDAMTKFPCDERLTLSQSFRFGSQIAREANKWLTVLGADLRLSGFERISSMLAPVDNADAVLCRTNAEAMAEAMAAMQVGRDTAIVGGGKEIRALAEAAITLKAGAGCSHPELFAFRTWGELQDYAENDPSGSDLLTLVRLIDDHGPDAVIDMVDQLTDEVRAEVVISTAHKAKGREWDSVRIGADFHEPRRNPEQPDEEPDVPADLAMLAYVAVTRARLTLDRSGLAWVDRYLPAPETTGAAA